MANSAQISTVVPVYNDPKGIRQTLDSITKQPGDKYDIYVSDNGSTDYTRDVIREYTRRLEERISPRRGRHPGFVCGPKQGDSTRKWRRNCLSRR